jgi:uncharacterized membrane protein YdjX (TVP38/TMEM64 family)
MVSHPRSVESSGSRFLPRFTLWRAVQLAAGALILGGIIVLASRMGWRELVQATLVRLREAGPLAFFGAMAVLPAIGFPLLPFTLAAGPAFGPSLGIGPVIACAVAAVMVNVALSYGIAVRWIAPLAERRGWKVPRPPERLTFLVLMLLRIAPGLPFWMQSYLLGLIRAPFVPYMAVSTLVPALYISGTVLASMAVLQGRRELAWFGVGGVLVVGSVLHWFRRRHAAEIAALKAPG